MSESMAPLLRVRNWDQRHENNRSRDMKRTEWFPASNDLSADSYVELVSHPDGPAHLGVWHAALMVASRARPRGLLVKEDTQPHSPESLARVTRLPEAIVKTALTRLLEIGLLEHISAGTIELPPHPGAGIPQAGAGNPQAPASASQEGAVEGKGIEHHHQEEKGKEKERKRTEPDGTERAGGERKTESSSSESNDAFFPREIDDGKEPEEVYASPDDELKAIYLAKAREPITIDLLDAIRLNLELNGVTIGDFVAEVKKHVGNRWRNPAGFIRNLSQCFRLKTQPASDPVMAAEAEEKNYRCLLCSSRVRGEGVILTNGKEAPCSCASPEYIARLRARGVFQAETPQ
jgi:hypothetical protein